MKLPIMSLPKHVKGKRTAAQWRKAFKDAKAAGKVQTVLSFPGDNDLPLRPIQKPAHPPTNTSVKNIRRAIGAVRKPRKRVLREPLPYQTGDRRPRPWQAMMADYEIKPIGHSGRFGIFVRRTGTRVAILTDGSDALCEALERMFTAAHALWLNVAIFKLEKQLYYAKHDRSGYYLCGCGQWVHDKLAPCTVCKPKRRKKKR